LITHRFNKIGKEEEGNEVTRKLRKILFPTAEEEGEITETACFSPSASTRSMSNRKK
jgi:hypothetical protein